MKHSPPHLTSNSPLAQTTTPPSATSRASTALRPSIADQKNNLELSQQRTEGRFKITIWSIGISMCVLLIAMYFYKTYTLDLNKLDLKNWLIVPIIASPLIASVIILIALLKSIGQIKTENNKTDDKANTPLVESAAKELAKIITTASKHL